MATADAAKSLGAFKSAEEHLSQPKTAEAEKITILKTNTPYPSWKIRRIRACTHQRPKRIKLNTPYPERLNMLYSKMNTE
ncbi:hypothetical protein Tco_0647624 [Tanacetum coccineum]